ncbi:hypothetical protein H310_12302 [Aphanomyces invadans]|uniref:Uncharacterized protein n=1 Tax=Aphanomyces invadans TaxID=157072 RepID=A0A024TJ27_9STRA|nr:hypothetical protein H310_12302 [Aphanomyces invadans]ETV93974.1 hypothetical protein H310_12302 [Aphanomyces invadans]|eukprot:XP_008877534.1 hypothetical protein H310_12302 [Aphanomyces invadans]
MANIEFVMLSPRCCVRLEGGAFPSRVVATCMLRVLSHNPPPSCNVSVARMHASRAFGRKCTPKEVGMMCPLSFSTTSRHQDMKLLHLPSNDQRVESTSGPYLGYPLLWFHLCRSDKDEC